VIGTIVSPYLQYLNHTFRAIDPSHVNLFETGIEIKAGNDYEGYNLEDTSKTTLILEVAGGLCDYSLGESFVTLTLPYCGWSGETLIQTSYRREYEVIAQIVELKLTHVRSVVDQSPKSNIIEKFQSDLRSIDLSDISEDSNQSDQSNATLQPNETNKVRFQYNGNDVVTTSLGFMPTKSCPGTRDAGSLYSYHVMQSLEVTPILITVHQNFGYDIPICTKYPNGTKITIRNQLGFASSTEDALFRETLLADSQKASLVPILDKCNPSCSQELQFDESGAGAYFYDWVVGGLPNKNSPYTKLLYVTLEKSGATRKSEVVVTGDYEPPGGATVPLPTHKPLLVLRDPPGGASFSYYNNIRTTIRVRLKGYTAFNGRDDGMWCNNHSFHLLYDFRYSSFSLFFYHNFFNWLTSFLQVVMLLLVCLVLPKFHQ
jgi:hypothetical protein